MLVYKDSLRAQGKQRERLDSLTDQGLSKERWKDYSSSFASEFFQANGYARRPRTPCLSTKPKSKKKVETDTLKYAINELKKTRPVPQPNIAEAKAGLDGATREAAKKPRRLKARSTTSRP